MNRLLLHLTGVCTFTLMAGVLLAFVVVGAFTYLTFTTIRMKQVSSDARHVAWLMEKQVWSKNAAPVDIAQVFREYSEVVGMQYDLLLCDSRGRVVARHAASQLARVDSVSTALTGEFVAVYPLLSRFFSSGSNMVVFPDGSAAPFQAAQLRTRQEAMWLLAFPRYLLSASVLSRLLLFYIVFSIIVFLFIAAVLGLVLYKRVADRLQTVNTVVVELEKGNLDARVPVAPTDRPDDITILGMRVNRIADVMQGVMERFRVQDESHNALLATISHELRTPMMIAQGCMETVLIHKGSMEEEKQDAYIQSALREIGNLDRLVQQLFEISTLDIARDKAMRWEYIPYDELLHSVVMQHRMAADQEEKVLLLSMPEHLPEIRIDPRRIISVVNILLATAFRHTLKGGRIEVMVQYDDTEKTITTRIRGDGEAPDIDNLPVMPDSFCREEQQWYGNRNRPYAEYGLALCRRIIELHGGTIDVQGAPGVCTAFAFSLPVVSADEFSACCVCRRISCPAGAMNQSRCHWR